MEAFGNFKLLSVTFSISEPKIPDPKFKNPKPVPYRNCRNQYFKYFRLVKSTDACKVHLGPSSTMGNMISQVGGEQKSKKWSYWCAKAVS